MSPRTLRSRPWIAGFLLMACLISLPVGASEGTITTIAGTGASGSRGDGGQATAADLFAPGGVDVAPDGSILIADTYNHRIRRIDASGVITKVAGTSSGFGGDGGPASGAMLRYPGDVAVDSSGNVYIADTDNDRVRRVDAQGVISTIAGGSAVTSSCYKSGIPATQACLDGPLGIDVAADDSVIVADTYNLRVVRIGTDGILTTLAGNPYGRGYWGDGGPASQAWLNLPEDVAVDGSSVYIADTRNHRIRKIDSNGIITTVAGNGQGYVDEHPDGWIESGSMFGGAEEGKEATEAAVMLPMGVAVRGGRIFMSSGAQHRVLQVDDEGLIWTVAGRGYCSVGSVPLVAEPQLLIGDEGAAEEACVMSPRGLAFDLSGNLLIANDGNSRIRKVIGSF